MWNRSAVRSTLEQVFAFADAIQPRYRLVVLLATFTSLRYGEIMGLRRKDFAHRDRKVKIDRAHIQPDTGPRFDGDPSPQRAHRKPARFPSPRGQSTPGRIRPARTRCLRVPRIQGRSPST